MPCPLCGDICRCSIDGDSSASSSWSTYGAAGLPPERSEDRSEERCEEPLQAPVAEAPGNAAASAPADSDTWRQEVAARLNRYQSKRKPKPPRYPSLRLRFDEPDSTRSASAASEDSFHPPSIGATSHHALALDNFADSTAVPDTQISHPQTRDLQDPGPVRADDSSPQPVFPAPSATAKIIEFPRSWTPPPPPLDELAEPVIDRPRILEAPEIVPPPPAMGGIIIEPALQPELEKRPGIDIPLQSTPLSRRILSAAIDAVIIAAAAAVFGLIFWKITAIEPPRLQLAGLAAGLLALFWAAYQYLLVVYSGSTPGLRLAKLELARFDGTPASRRLRRWRVLASFLSAVSLGMGYAWVFLDEDALCWHDRITHTYLAPAKRIQL